MSENVPDDERLQRIQRYADGIATAEEVAQLQAELRKDAALRQVFLDYVHLDGALGALAAGLHGAAEAARTEANVIPVSRRRFRPMLWLGAAAAAIVVVAIWSPGSRGPADRGVDVEIVHSESVQWIAPAHRNAQVGARFPLRTIELASGALNLRLAASDVLLKLNGPIEARFETPMRLRVVHGRLSADVGPGGIGFTVATDAGEVVDLGTSFGVEAERGGESRVAVFSGQVKVRPGFEAQGNEFTTLSEGEAVRFSKLAKLRRWEQVAMASEAAGRLSPDSSEVVAAVRDNLDDEKLHPFYGVVAEGMRRGALAFTDKPNPRWAPAPEDVLPAWLEGADVIRTYHNFRYVSDYELTLTLRQAATVFILIDARQPVPSWLTQRFTATGTRVTVGPWQPAMLADEGIIQRADGLPYLEFAVWRAEAGPGEFRLAAPRDPKLNTAALMYGVAVKAVSP